MGRSHDPITPCSHDPMIAMLVGYAYKHSLAGREHRSDRAAELRILVAHMLVRADCERRQCFLGAESTAGGRQFGGGAGGNSALCDGGDRGAWRRRALGYAPLRAGAVSAEERVHEVGELGAWVGAGWRRSRARPESGAPARRLGREVDGRRGRARRERGRSRCRGWHDCCWSGKSIEGGLGEVVMCSREAVGVVGVRYV